MKSPYIHVSPSEQNFCKYNFHKIQLFKGRNTTNENHAIVEYYAICHQLY